MKKIIAIMAIIGIVFSSCNGKYMIAKRKYNKGFYVSKSGNSSAKPAVAHSKTTKVIAAEEKIEAVVVNAQPISKESSVESANLIMPVKDLAKSSENDKNTPSQTKVQAPVVASNYSNYTPQPIKFKNVTLEKSDVKSEKKGGSSDAKFILCVILAIFIPPLGMYLWDKKTDFWFILDLILFILLFSWFFWGSLGLVGLAAVVIALLRVFEAI